MKKLNVYIFSLLTLALSLISLPSFAGNIYRFLDKNGISTLSKTLPPDVAQQGYEILDDKTLRVIERVPTRKEMIEQYILAQQQQKEEQIRLEKQALDKRLKKEQDLADKNLLAIYPSVEDLIKARDRDQVYLNKQIGDSTSQKDYLKQTLHQLEQSAAEQELSGQTISSKLSQRIKAIQQDIIDNQSHIERLQDDKQSNAQQYEKDLIRLQQLQDINDNTPDNDHH